MKYRFLWVRDEVKLQALSPCFTTTGRKLAFRGMSESRQWRRTLLGGVNVVPGTGLYALGELSVYWSGVFWNCPG